MILSDKSIKEKVGKEIFIKPFNEKNVQPASYDLCLGNTFMKYNLNKLQIVDPKIASGDAFETINVKDDGCFILHPFDFVLAKIREKTGVDNKHVGRLEGKSSIGRLGVFVHVTAGFLDPGNNLNMTLELFNASPLPIKLYPGMKIAQMAFEMLDRKCKKPYGSKGLKNKYVGDKKVIPSKINENFEVDRAEQFAIIAKECQALFEKKNKAYGDDYFSGDYPDIERWMSIKRKIARLSSKYEKGNEGMPDETLKDTWMDLAIYAIMELIMMEKKNET